MPYVTPSEATQPNHMWWDTGKGVQNKHGAEREIAGASVQHSMNACRATERQTIWNETFFGFFLFTPAIRLCRRVGWARDLWGRLCVVFCGTLVFGTLPQSFVQFWGKL